MELRHIDDYYEILKEEYPDLTEDDFKKILTHGFMSFYALNNLGADFTVTNKKKNALFYFGCLFNTSSSWLKYRAKKKKTKLFLNYYNEANRVWDGNYYFGLTEEAFQKLNWPKNGRIKKKLVFEDIFCNKVKEIPQIYSCYKYFFRLTGVEDDGMSIHLDRLETRNVTLIAIRDANKKIKSIDG